MHVQVKELSIDGMVGGDERCNVLWQCVDPGMELITFWTRNLEFVPDIHATYEFEPRGKHLVLYTAADFKLLT